MDASVSLRRRTTKTRLKGRRYWIEARDQGQDLHILIGRRDGSGTKAHFIIDARTAEIRVEDQRAVPEDLVRSLESTLTMRDGKAIRFIRDVQSQTWHVAGSEFDLLPGFGASVLQTGGVGSHLVTRLAWATTEHGYLPADPLLSHFFTSGGDFLVVAPRDGFVITAAHSPTGNDVERDDDGHWCRLFLLDQLKNEVVLECSRVGAHKAVVCAE